MTKKQKETEKKPLRKSLKIRKGGSVTIEAPKIKEEIKNASES